MMLFVRASLAWACLAVALVAAEPNGKEIIRRSIASGTNINFDRARNYTYTKRVEIRRLSSDNKVTDRDSKTYEVVTVYGRAYERLVAKNDKPLSEADARSEREKEDHEMAKRKREIEAPGGKNSDRDRERRILNEIPDMYTWTVAGKETIAGRPVWMLDAVPRSDYQAKESRARMFQKVKARLWVDQADYQWVKADAEAIDTLTYGFFLARLSPGGRINIRQTRVNDEVWLPSRIELRFDVRVALIKKIKAEIDIAYSNFKKFQSDSKLTSAVIQ